MEAREKQTRTAYLDRWCGRINHVLLTVGNMGGDWSGVGASGQILVFPCWAEHQTECGPSGRFKIMALHLGFDE